MKVRLPFIGLMLLSALFAGCVGSLPGGPGTPSPRLPGGGGGTVGMIEVPIRAPLDDGWRDGSNDPATMVLGSESIWFGGSPGSYTADAVFRWSGVLIPKDVKIVEAYVKVKHIPTSSPGINKWNTRVDIRGFAYDNLSAFKTSQDVAALQRTEAFVEWDILEPWSSTEALWHRTPDLSEIIQEIVDRPGWRAGNALGIVFLSRPGYRPTEYNRSIYTYEADKDSAAVLVVKFTR